MADRRPDDEDEDDDLDPVSDDDDGPPDSAAEDSGPSDGDVDLDDLLDDEEDDDEDGAHGGGKLRLIAILAGTIVLFTGAAGGAYFVLFGGDEPEGAPEPAALMADTEPGTAMLIQRPDERRMLTGQELAERQAEPPEATTPPQASGNGAGPQAMDKGAKEAPAAPDGALTPPPAAMAPGATPPAGGAGAPSAGQMAAATAAANASASGAATATTPAPEPGVARTQPDAPGGGLVVPAVAAAAYRDLTLKPEGKALPAPDAALTEVTDVGNLPRAVKGGYGPWKAYAAPAEAATDKPRIAIILTGLGLSRAATLASITQMPSGISVAFDPYARNLEDLIGLARSSGHEALLHLPMEPSDFPISDPGPLAMLTELAPAQNIQRLHRVLASGIGYVGVLQVMGSKFEASETALRPVLEELKTRGLLYVDMDSGAEDRGAIIAKEIGLPVTQVDLKLDNIATTSAIDAQLAELERIARERSFAVAIAEPYPVTLSRLSFWAQSLSFKELTLAPVSALVSVGGPKPGVARAAGQP